MTAPSLNEMSNAASREFDSVAAVGFERGSRSRSNHRSETKAGSVLCTTSSHAAPNGWSRRIAAAFEFAGHALGHALPQSCALCGARSGARVLCEPCMNDLPGLPAACPVCAQPSPTATQCGVCLKHPPAFSTTLAACAYAFPLDQLIQGLKYSHRLHLAHPLGDALAAKVLRASPVYRPPDVLVALPLAAARQRERGFNQAMEIARVVARQTRRPLVGGIIRTVAGPAQASLRWKLRHRNVKGAFACTKPFTGQSVAVIDDVMTTGATLHAAATALLRAGAARVDCWVVARTLAD